MFYCVQCACHPSNFEATQTFSQLNLYINHICHGVQKLIISVSIWKVWEVSCSALKRTKHAGSSWRHPSALRALLGRRWNQNISSDNQRKLAPVRFHLIADTSISQGSRAELLALTVPADDALHVRAIALSRHRLFSKSLATKDISDCVVFDITD